jgi:hypothetical protein
MSGNLDDQSLRCTGSARVTASGERGGDQCIGWALVDPQCKGDRKSVDWLHENKDTGRICATQNNGWDLATRLPGRAFCDVKVTVKNGTPASISLSCTWQCRGGADACAGEATYQFTTSPKR